MPGRTNKKRREIRLIAVDYSNESILTIKQMRLTILTLLLMKVKKRGLLKAVKSNLCQANGPDYSVGHGNLLSNRSNKSPRDSKKLIFTYKEPERSQLNVMHGSHELLSFSCNAVSAGQFMSLAKFTRALNLPKNFI